MAFDRDDEEDDEDDDADDDEAEDKEDYVDRLDDVGVVGSEGQVGPAANCCGEGLLKPLPLVLLLSRLGGRAEAVQAPEPTKQLSGEVPKMPPLWNQRNLATQ